MQKSILLKSMMANRMTQSRAFSSAAFNVKSKFEEAYAEKMERLNAVQEKV